MNTNESRNPHFRAWVANTVYAISADAPALPDVEPKKSPKTKTVKGRAYVSGVYFLERAGVVVYVGQSGNFYARLAQHMERASFEFDSFTLKPCEAGDRLRLEAQMIREYRPAENRDIPAYCGIPYESRARHIAGE